ncbi:hypothetical protein l11_07000 [Neisseria weaveri LMG 5135]|nr:hypothetical protein l11_07000 [Neisseria weaveri LMG 5135]
MVFSDGLHQKGRLKKGWIMKWILSVLLAVRNLLYGGKPEV